MPSRELASSVRSAAPVPGQNSSTAACQPRLQSTSRGESAGDVALAVHAGRHADSLTAWIIGHDGWAMDWAEMGN